MIFKTISNCSVYTKSAQLAKRGLKHGIINIEKQDKLSIILILLFNQKIRIKILFVKT